MKAFLAALLFALGAAVPTASAHDMQDHAGHEHSGHAHNKPACSDPRPACGVTVTPTFAADGQLWVAYAVGGIVYVASSPDRGKTFASPIAVNKQPFNLDDNGEARPKLLQLANHIVLVTFGVRRDQDYNGTLMLSRSTDGGHSFMAPAPLIDDASQRFDTLAMAPNGRIYIAWLDKRNLKTAQQQGKPYTGSGFALAWSDDGGASFSGKQILVDHTCECCRIAMGFDTDGQPVFAWRQIFGKNIRDHMAAKLAANGTLQQIRVSNDDWAVDACPHHGPSLAVDAAGTWHVVWYTGGSKRKGLFYAYRTSDAASFSPPQAFGDPDHAPSHPQLLRVGSQLFRAWKEFDGTTTAIRSQMSHDDGRNWSQAATMAETTDSSDHLVLVSDGKTAYLSWLTHNEGYRLIPLMQGGER